MALNDEDKKKIEKGQLDDFLKRFNFNISDRVVYEYKEGTKDGIPRPLSIVRLDYDSLPQVLAEDYDKNFNRNEGYLFLGEIPNMPGHCAVISSNGRTLWGYHTEDFVEINNEEDHYEGDTSGVTPEED